VLAAALSAALVVVLSDAELEQAVRLTADATSMTVAVA
jgi:hypothetical protein